MYFNETSKNSFLSEALRHALIGDVITSQFKVITTFFQCGIMQYANNKFFVLNLRLSLGNLWPLNPNLASVWFY